MAKLSKCKPISNSEILNINTFIVENRMKKRKITIKALASKTGVSQSTIRRICSGQQDRTHKRTLENIAKVLGVSADRITNTYSYKDIEKMFGDDDIPF